MLCRVTNLTFHVRLGVLSSSHADTLLLHHLVWKGNSSNSGGGQTAPSSTSGGGLVAHTAWLPAHRAVLLEAISSGSPRLIANAVTHVMVS